MPTFILKPIMWNTLGYVRPSGFGAGGGFPADHGFGHEEWNNSIANRYTDDGVRYRAFHTERIGNTVPEVGGTFVFLYASHHGVQQLVGIAGNATCLIEDKQRREDLANRLALFDLWQQAWDVDLVQARCPNEATFLERWNAELHWIPNWTCPEDMFLWLDEPVTLDPLEITGRRRLTTMYNAFHLVSADLAARVMEFIPQGQRNEVWGKLYQGVVNFQGVVDAEASSAAEDLAEIATRTDISETERSALVAARVGQGGFRALLDNRWNGQCAVTGCGLRTVLRASHIKPWRSSSDQERLDGNNGLLLAAHIDALFDAGLISFDGGGEMIISDKVPAAERERFGLPRALRYPPNAIEQAYLACHRDMHGLLP